MRIHNQLLRLLSLLILIVLTLSIITACTPRDFQTNGSPIISEVRNASINSTQEIDQSEEIITEEDELNEQFFLIEEIIIGLLFIATLVGIFAQRLRVPYTVGLVIMGLALTIFGQIEITITPNLILAVLVPPLVFEAAFHINYNDLRRNLAPILAFAVPGVLVTTILVGFIISRGVGLPITHALIFGTVISATDPISVVALFRRLGVPRRLQLLLEGESLFNDGTAIVIFNIFIAITMAGVETFSFINSIFEFIYVSGGGLIIGLILGTLISQVITRVDDHLIETTLTSVLAYGAYLIAEVIGVSGVLAVVAAGLVNGNVGPRGMSPTTRIVVYNFWEYAAFLANSFVFLLIGLQIDLDILFINWKAILWGIAGVLIARVVVVYGLSWIGRNIQMKWRHVLFWGGLRGAIALALALSLPAELGLARSQIQSMVFSVVLFSLIIQGFSMAPLARRLGLVHRDELRIEYERRHARAVASQSAYDHLHHMYRQGLISNHTWQILSNPLKEHNQAMVDTVHETMSRYPDIGAEELETARREYLHSQRSTLSTLLTNGIISEETYSQLVTEIDAALIETQLTWPELFVGQSTRRKSINRLVTAVLQEQDVESAMSSLLKLGFSVTRLPSSGGFLGRRSTTLLIGLAEGMEEAMTRAIYQSCKTRVEYITLPIEGSPMPLPIPTPITVGGATIFTIEVELYEEF
jgi:monovalent cation:H+ antiporter, CPA1 family